MNEPRTPGLFEPLEPPPGGLVALRRRIAHERVRERRLRAARATAGALVLVALGATAFWPRPGAPPTTAIDFDLARVRLGALPPPAEPVTIPAAAQDTIAALRVPVGGDTVVYYRIASLAGALPDLAGVPESPTP